MEIIRLPAGETAPADVDCIVIDTLPDGRANLMGTALCGGESVATTGTAFASYEAAEEQGLAWADAQGVAVLYVARDAPFPSD